MARKKKPSQKMQAWIDARRRHQLTHAQIQMARELGMSPKDLDSLDNHDQELWKMPLRQYIDYLYVKHFGKERPDIVLSIEEKVRLAKAKKARKREAKIQARQARSVDESQG